MFISGSHRKLTGTDPLFGSVSLLLHGNTNFADSSANNFTPTLTNTPTIDTGTKKFGAGSMKFVRASSQAVTYPNNSATAGVFSGTGSSGTVELWFNFTSTSNYAHLIGAQNGIFGAGAWSVVTNYSFTGSIDMWFTDFSNSVPIFTSGATNYADGLWHHLAITRSGTTMRMFIDGVLVNTQTVPATISAPPGVLSLGTDQAVGRSYDGFIDDVRITAGAARYTSAFTPPSAEFPNS